MTTQAARPADSFALALRLARRELRGGVRGFRTFLACLALGVAAIAAIGSLSSAVNAGLEADARRLLGGDLDIRTVHRPIGATALGWLKARGTVSNTVGLRTMARRPGAETRTLVQLKAVDGAYPLFGELELDPVQPAARALARLDGNWGAAAEAGLLTRLGLGLGDAVRIGDTLYRIRAVIGSEPDRGGGLRALSLGQRLMVSAASLTDTGLIRPGSLVHYHYRVRLAPGDRLDIFRRELDAAFPDAGWRVRDTTNATPAIRRFIDRTALFLTLVGLTALLVGGVGVGNAVQGFLDQKKSVIATLKCLGAPQSLIFRTYLILILAMATGGIALGLIAGGVAPLALARLVADVLPAAARVSFYPAPMALAAAFGLLTAFAFSLWPIARACLVPPGSLYRDLIAPAASRPRPAHIAAIAVAIITLAALAVLAADDRGLALWFVAGSIGAVALFRTAAWGVQRIARALRGRGSARLRLALGNLHRPGTATSGIVLSLGLGLTVLVTVAMIEGNLTRLIRDTMPDKAPGYYFIDIQPGQTTGFDETVNRVPGVRALHRVPMLRGRVTAVNGVPADKAKVAKDVAWVLRNDRGLTWARAAPVGTRLTAGSWWAEDHAGPPLVSLAADIAEGFGVGVGDSLTVDILGRRITARISSLRDVAWGTLRMNFVLVFSPGVIEEAPQTHIATVHADRGAEVRVERAVAKRFPNITSIRVRDVLQTAGEILGRIAVAVRATAAITVLAGALVLGGAIAAGHRRRVYDAVVFKVLGARRRDVAAAYLMEYGLLGIATAIIAAAAGTVAAAVVLVQVMHIDWTFLPGTVAATATAAVGLVVAIGFIGTWFAMGRKAAPLLHNE